MRILSNINIRQRSAEGAFLQPSKLSEDLWTEREDSTINSHGALKGIDPTVPCMGKVVFKSTQQEPKPWTYQENLKNLTTQRAKSKRTYLWVYTFWESLTNLPCSETDWNAIRRCAQVVAGPAKLEAEASSVGVGQWVEIIHPSAYGPNTVLGDFLGVVQHGAPLSFCKKLAKKAHTDTPNPNNPTTPPPNEPAAPPADTRNEVDDPSGRPGERGRITPESPAAVPLPDSSVLEGLLGLKGLGASHLLEGGPQSQAELRQRIKDSGLFKCKWGVGPTVRGTGATEQFAAKCERRWDHLARLYWDAGPEGTTYLNERRRKAIWGSQAGKRKKAVLIGNGMTSKRKYNGETANHNALDLWVNVGTKLYSPENGKVIISEDYKKTYKEGSGKYCGGKLSIRYSGGRTMTLCHMSSSPLKAGDSIIKGQFLGKSGGVKGQPGAGRTTGQHLHVQTKYKRKPVDATCWPGFLEILVNATEVKYSRSRKSGCIRSGER